MPIPGKEIEHRPDLDQVAMREVEGYVERIEKQVEAQNQQQQSPQIPTATTPKTAFTDMGSVVTAQFAAVTKPNIVLPLNQTQIEEGLHRKIIDGVAWLAEWCVMMIKKYPGRVFYMPPNQRT